jgi:hypothetical protein
MTTNQLLFGHALALALLIMGMAGVFSRDDKR